MSEYAHRITGTDIHAGANRFTHFIDHATGIVIEKQQSLKKCENIPRGNLEQVLAKT
jgi:serine O-acetyltransferase